MEWLEGQGSEVFKLEINSKLLKLGITLILFSHSPYSLLDLSK